jgi:hypothetical protein
MILGNTYCPLNLSTHRVIVGWCQMKNSVMVLAPLLHSTIVSELIVTADG